MTRPRPVLIWKNRLNSLVGPTITGRANLSTGWFCHACLLSDIERRRSDRCCQRTLPNSTIARLSIARSCHRAPRTGSVDDRHLAATGRPLAFTGAEAGGDEAGGDEVGRRPAHRCHRPPALPSRYPILVSGTLFSRLATEAAVSPRVPQLTRERRGHDRLALARPTDLGQELCDFVCAFVRQFGRSRAALFQRRERHSASGAHADRSRRVYGEDVR